MHAVVIIDSLGIGGAERLLVMLARHAHRADVDLTVISLRDLDSRVVPDALRDAGTEVRYVTTRRRHHLMDPHRLLRLAAELRRLRPDVVHTHLGQANILGVAAARMASVPVVTTLHSMRREISRPRQRLHDEALRRSDAIVAVGATVARTYAAAVAPHPIDVVANPVDCDALVPTGDVAAVRREILGGGSGPIVVSIGRLEPPKGHLDLVEAMHLVAARNPSVVAAIAGDGRLAGAVRDRVAALGLEANVRLLGSRRDVAELLAAADVFVSPSIHEGLPLSVLEAMAAGAPVVATDVGDVGAVIEGSGVLVPPSDPKRLATAISEVLEDASLRALMAQRGRQIVEERADPGRWMERLREVYERVGRRAPSGVR